MRKYIEHIAERYHVSLTTLSVELGYNSSTTLFRLMDANVRKKSLRDFRQRMKEHFSLSADEIEELEYVVDKKLEGEEFAKQSRAVHRFVSNSSETTTPLCVVLPNGTSVEAFPEPIDQWKITLMNACHPNVINFFQKMVAQGASMDHYFFKPLDIEQIKNLLPILFLKQYRLWQREVGCRQHPSF